MISQASIAHIGVLAALHEQCFPAEPWNAGTFLNLLSQPGMHAFIDPRGGFLLLRRVLDEAEIITLGASPARQGIATALLAAALDHARTWNITKIHLEVAADNVPARALYEKFGFLPAGLRRGYYANGADALTMTREASTA